MKEHNIIGSIICIVKLGGGLVNVALKTAVYYCISKLTI